jgi:anti-sigma B factor antagonist
MEIETREFKHCFLVKIKGRLDSATSPEFAKALDELTGHGHYKIVVDFKELEFITSAGLRVLINTQKTCKRYNRGEVVLSSVPSNIYASLDLTGFTVLFKIFSDELTAVGNF